MKKLKTVAGILCFLLMVSGAGGQTVRHDPADVIVLMDTSGTVLPYYEAINKRVLQSIITKFIRIEDVFHLLSFSAVPRYEMSQKINTEADLSRVVSRFMLLYQLGQSADFLSGITFAEQYMKKLPSQQDKILIVISDGIFNPPASSPYRRYTGEQIKTELAKVSASIRAQGWKVYYVKLPFPSDAVIKNLDGAFYAGKLNEAGTIDRAGVDTIDTQPVATTGDASALRTSGSTAAHANEEASSAPAIRGRTAASGNADSTGASRVQGKGSAAETRNTATAATAGTSATAEPAASADAADSRTVEHSEHTLQQSGIRQAAAGRQSQGEASITGSSDGYGDPTASGSMTGSNRHAQDTGAGNGMVGTAARGHEGQNRRTAADQKSNGFTGVTDAADEAAGDAAASNNSSAASVSNGEQASPAVSEASPTETSLQSQTAHADTTEAAAQSAAQNIKEYTDVSQAFTENLGIEPSSLPPEGNIAFSDTVLPLPRIVFPNEAHTAGATVRLPLTVVNEASETIEITVQSITVEANGGVQKQPLKNQVIRVDPNAARTFTATATLPDSIRSEGSHQAVIRLDMVQQDKPFSQAASVALTVRPGFALLGTETLPWILAAICLGVLGLILFIIVRRRAVEPVRHAARVVKRQSDENRQPNAPYTHNIHRRFDTHETAERAKELQPSRVGTVDTLYHSEHPANSTDPRESLNTFSSQTAVAAAITQQETASQLNYLAQEHSRTMEGRFALLNTANNRMSRRPGFGQHYHNGHISQKPPQSGMTELFVYNQNTSIGKRNIHVMKPGARMSIGGSKNDDFLIFLVPFPANLAQIQYDGREYRVSILKPEYFPYEKSATVDRCIGRDITVVSKKGYHVTFTFRGYEDPMVKLNTILTSINYESDSDQP